MNNLILTILFFLGVSLLFYILFAGADFGAGILELFSRRSDLQAQRKLISRAMAPVWEANHVWLILAVVILFMGFPPIYTLLSTYLYLPLMALLMGIVARGCAFTFRYYDTIGNNSHRLYSRIFAISSLWSSFFLGILAGATMLGKISTDAPDFPSAYFQPWFNLFCFSMGGFTSSLFALLAAIYLIGEAKDDSELRTLFKRRASVANFAVIFSGALVFICAEIDGFPLFRSFFSNPVSLGSFVVATLLWIPLFLSLKKLQNTVLIRGLAIGIVALVLLGWFAVRFPVAVEILHDGLPSQILFENAAAPEATLRALLWALVGGVLLIFPALAYLLKIFKWETIEKVGK